MSGIVGIRGTNVGDFQHHVRVDDWIPEGDADVLHAVAWLFPRSASL